ncbi:MAG: ATP-dependent 6-phosphofructokinase [bacterium]|jgi:6-phosphofructokinase 1|nr:ATP-dependent 6-phosphofructokinase [bacterium]
MNSTPTPDFTVRTLGPCRYKSPLQLSRIMGDYAPNSVADSERIVYPRRLSEIKTCSDAGRDILSFEAAGPRECIFFNPSDVKAAIVTCGGLCPGLNDVIKGLVRGMTYQYKIKTIYGILYGYQGLVERSMLEPLLLTPERVETISNEGGTILGSSRGPQPVEEMVDFLAKRGIQILFTIGGDGTLRGALALTEEIQRRGLDIAVIGIPKTIDNDIMYVEKSFGFETAYSIATQVLQSAHAEAKGAYNGVAIVKLMGRQSGFIAANASVASGEVNFTLVPEVPFDLQPPQGFLAALEERILRRHHALIVVAEGAGQDLFAKESITQTDASGNIKLEDIGLFVRDKVSRYFQERAIPISIKYIDPSYYIRSVPANPSDKMFCLRLAHNAIHAAMAGRTGMLVGYWNSDFTHLPIEAAVSRRNTIDPEEDLWLSVLESTGQPHRMVNMP